MSSRFLYHARNILLAPQKDMSFPSEANSAYFGVFFPPLNGYERITFVVLAITPSFGEMIVIALELFP